MRSIVKASDVIGLRVGALAAAAVIAESIMSGWAGVLSVVLAVAIGVIFWAGISTAIFIFEYVDMRSKHTDMQYFFGEYDYINDSLDAWREWIAKKAGLKLEKLDDTPLETER